MTPREMLSRRKGYEDAISLLRSAIRNDAVTARLCPPPRNLRRATDDDIAPGAILWTGKKPSAIFQRWAIVEGLVENHTLNAADRNKDHGTAFVYRGTIYRVKNCWVEKTL